MASYRGQLCARHAHMFDQYMAQQSVQGEPQHQASGHNCRRHSSIKPASHTQQQHHEFDGHSKQFETAEMARRKHAYQAHQANLSARRRSLYNGHGVTEDPVVQKSSRLNRLRQSATSLANKANHVLGAAPGFIASGVDNIGKVATAMPVALNQGLDAVNHVAKTVRKTKESLTGSHAANSAEITDVNQIINEARRSLRSADEAMNAHYSVQNRRGSGRRRGSGSGWENFVQSIRKSYTR